MFQIKHWYESDLFAIKSTLAKTVEECSEFCLDKTRIQYFILDNEIVKTLIHNEKSQHNQDK